MLLRAAESALVVVDMQARLVPALAEPEAVTDRVALLARVSKRLGVPVLASEQYPRGLGHTIAAVRDELPDDAVVEKIDFAATREAAFAARLAALGRCQIVVCGAETHVCVLQTAIEAAAGGYATFVAADACGSRRQSDKQAALERMARAGIDLVTSEMVAFEWLGRAGSDVFRDVSALIK